MYSDQDGYKIYEFPKGLEPRYYDSLEEAQKFVDFMSCDKKFNSVWSELESKGLTIG